MVFQPKYWNFTLYLYILNLLIYLMSNHLMGIFVLLDLSHNGCACERFLHYTPCSFCKARAGHVFKILLNIRLGIWWMRLGVTFNMAHWNLDWPWTPWIASIYKTYLSCLIWGQDTFEKFSLKSNTTIFFRTAIDNSWQKLQLIESVFCLLAVFLMSPVYFKTNCKKRISIIWIMQHG